MTWRYIVLLDGARAHADMTLPDPEETALAELGVSCCASLGHARVLSSADTPILQFPGGVALGYLFNREGERIIDASLLPTFSTHDDCLQHLLGKCWGEYLLVWTGHGQARDIHISRDPSGGARCVYSLQGGVGFVASDPSLAEAAGRYSKRIDWDAISLYLVYAHLSAQRTALSEIVELLPGCSLHIRDAGTNTSVDWSPWTYVEPAYRHSDSLEAAAEVRRTVESVVGAWAEADRSILLELSGGLDSSIIAACLRDTPARVTCGTLVTPVPGADEYQYASQVAVDLGVGLETATMDFEDARFEFIPPPQLVRPRINALQYAINEAMERAGAEHCVASYYSGGGGDTVFGYLGNASPAADAFRERGPRAAATAIRDLSELHQCTHWKATKLTLRKLIRAPRPAWKPDTSFLDVRNGAAAPDAHPWLDAAADALPGDRERIASLVGTQVFRDTAARGEHRSLRLPLLSQPVLEATLRVPSWMSIQGGRNRAVARAAFADALPAAVHARRSKGNFLQYCGAVFRRNRAGMHTFLLDGELGERGLLDRAALARFLQAPTTHDDAFMRIFDLCMIENWVRHQTPSAFASR